jgi:Oxidoreductase family, NAD-binding Rossmann fold
VVALPLPLHAAVVREALLAGKHVLIEKPFTQTLEEAHSLVGIAEKSSRVLMVSQNYRFFAAPQGRFTDRHQQSTHRRGVHHRDRVRLLRILCVPKDGP